MTTVKRQNRARGAPARTNNNNNNNSNGQGRPRQRRKRKNKNSASSAQVANLQNELTSVKNDITKVRLNKLRSGNRSDPLTYAHMRQKNGFDAHLNEYLETIMQPDIKTDVRIPDLSLFPCAVVQSRTVGVLSPTNGGNFSLNIQPFMKDGFLITNGQTAIAATNAAIVVDATTHTASATFDIHSYAQWEDVVDSYRPISMSVKLKSIAPPLTVQGRLAAACYPSSLTSHVTADTFDEVSDYNYSMVTEAKQGIHVLWLPLGPESLFLRDVDFAPPLGELPYLVIAGSGLGVVAAPPQLFTVEIVINFEVYSSNQLLTAYKTGGKPDMQKMNQAYAVAQEMYAKSPSGNGIVSTPDSGGFWKTALNIAKEVAPVALPIISAFV